MGKEIVKEIWGKRFLVKTKTKWPLVPNLYIPKKYSAGELRKFGDQNS